MRYSVVASAVLIGAASASLEGGVVSQIPDGQVQAPTAPVEHPVISSTVEQPVEESTSVADETIYQTQTYTVTSCAPTVTYCPATTAPYVTTSVVPIVSGTPVVPVETHPAPTSDNSPVQETQPSQPAPTSDNSPVQETNPAPQESSPVPTSDNSPVQETPIAGSVCPPTTCPPAVTSYVTVTVAPSGVPTSGPVPGTEAPGAGSPGAGVPGSEAPGAPGAGVPGVEAPGVGVPGSEAPGAGVPGSQAPGAGVPGVEAPGAGAPGAPGAGAPGSEGAAIPSVVDNSPVQPPFATGPAVVPGASGVAAGTASTGGVFPGPTGAPITPFTGAASTFSGSFVAAGLAAMAAIFFV